MRVVITGAGAVGRHLANDLAERGHAVTVIEQEPAVAGKADRPGVRVILGDGCEPWVLEQAELRTADVLVAATGDDEDNLVISLLAKQEFGVPRVLARVNNPDNEWMFNEMWGVDVSVSTPHLLTGLVEEAVSVGSFVRLLALAHGTTQLAEVTLTATSPAVGREIGQLGLPRESTVVALLRHSQIVVPHADLVLRAGDEVLATATAAVKQACGLSPDVEFSCEDATRSDPAFVAQVIGSAIAEGAGTINIPDLANQYGLDLPADPFDFLDRAWGPQRITPEPGPILLRPDGSAAYPLAVVLDDIRSARESGGDPVRLRARLEAARAPIDRKRTAHEQDLSSLAARWDAQADGPADERRRVLEQLRQRLLERNYLNNLIATIEREITALGAARG